MRDRFADLEAARLAAVVVLCQKETAVAAWLSRHPLPFPLLVDDDRSRAKRWGVYVRLSYDGIHIARPASFVVGIDGAIRYARLSRHQMNPAPLDEILTRA